MIGIYIREAAMMTMTCGAGSDDTKRRAIVPIDFKLSSWRFTKQQNKLPETILWEGTFSSIQVAKKHWPYRRIDQQCSW